MSMHDRHFPSRADVLAATAAPNLRGARSVSLVLAAVGLLVFVAGLFVAPDRAWRAFHVNWLFFTTISSAGVMFVAAQRITTARWSRPVIRFLEGYVAFLPVAFVFLALILVAGRGHIFPWAHVAPPSAEKRVWLDPTFLTVRDLAAFGVLALLSLYYIYTSLRLDVGLVPEGGAGWARALRARMRAGFREERREIHSTHSLQGKLAVFLALAFGFIWTMLAWDLSMSLDLHFQSTLYGWWSFMTGWLGAIMSFTLLTMWWRRRLNVPHLVTDAHLHDLGKLCFAFTAFWGYLTFSQFLVIWYGNLGEETHFMRLRLIAPWKEVTLALIFLTFAIPFLGLLSKAAKLYWPVMTFFAVVSLIGTWLQRYLEVYPSLYGIAQHTPLGLWEAGVTLLYLGVWLLCYFGFMDAFPRMRVTLMTSPYRDEVQVPVDSETMEPLPAHE